MFNKTVFYKDTDSIEPAVMEEIIKSTTYENVINIDPVESGLENYDDYLRYAAKAVSCNLPFMMNSNRNYMATFTSNSFTITINNITFGIKFIAKNGKVTYRVTVGFNVDSSIMLASDNCKKMIANGWKQMVSKGK